MNPTQPLLSVTNNRLTFTEFFGYLRRQLRLPPLATAALAEKVLLTGARESGVEIPVADLQRSANRWRRKLGLDGAERTHAWLAANGLTSLDLQEIVESELLIASFKEQLATEGLEARFDRQQERFASAKLTRLVAADEALARELLTQVQEGGDFLELAAAHDLPVQGPALAYRFQLPAEQADVIFGAAAGEVVGPFPGSGFSLVRVEEILSPQLDEVATEVLGLEAVQGWLSDRMANLQFDWSSSE